MVAQIENGHMCPITMTRAAVAALAAEPAVCAALMPKLAGHAYDPAFKSWKDKTAMTIGMGMTERQGGTDVRTNMTRAEQSGDGYVVNGEKWFMSAPMCDGFLVLAQAKGGLTCFFMPRFRPDGSVNGLHFRKLKDKLGNQSNASSEVEFHNAYAQRVGAEGAGIRTIIEMVQLTRLDCAIASAGLMRMALAQALHHSRHRTVFQKKLVDQPMMRSVLTDLALTMEGIVALVMRLCHAFDHAASRSERSGLCTAADAGGEVFRLQARAGICLRGDGVPGRQWLRRGLHDDGASLSGGARQCDLGRLRQCHGPRHAARAVARLRSRATGDREPGGAGG